jgi:hypothetical protein
MSNLNRVFKALKKHHKGSDFSRKQLKKLAVITAKKYPMFHFFS